MASPVNEGDILAGKYRVESILGEGGMGVVVAATHLALGQRVALKFLLPEASTQSETVARFLREAQAAVKIKGEHVARVTDVGTLDSGLPFMVMEYLEGSDLGQVLDEHGPLSIEDAVDHVLQACEAVAEAHSVGVIHRDLKPANLFLTHRADGLPCVKVLDFGISKVTPIAGSTSLGMTKTRDVIGSPFYMSPEQMRSSRTVDPRADIWSLGVILYELLTGELPFKGETVTEICAAVLQDPLPQLKSKRSDTPEALDWIINKCLARDPDQRFPTVADLAGALFPLATEHGRSSADRATRILHGTSLLPLTSSGQTELDHATWGAPVVAGRLRRGGWLVASAALITLAIGAWAAHRYAPRPRAAQPAARGYQTTGPTLDRTAPPSAQASASAAPSSSARSGPSTSTAPSHPVLVRRAPSATSATLPRRATQGAETSSSAAEVTMTLPQLVAISTQESAPPESSAHTPQPASTPRPPLPVREPPWDEP